MGFTPPRKQYRLKFQDSDLEGLEVLMNSASLGDIMALQSMDTGDTTPENLEKLLSILERAMVSWNVEIDGEPVPATLAGFEKMDISFVMAIISSWTEAISGVAPPLPGSSPSGETYQEVSLPMEPLSPNQGS